MGRHSWHMQSCLFYFKIRNSRTDMQDLSQKETQTAMVWLGKDLPMEGVEHSRLHTAKSKCVKNPVIHRAAYIVGVARLEGDLPEVFEDMVADSQNCDTFDFSQQQLAVGCLESNLKADNLKACDILMHPVQNSTKNIPLVPDIIIEHVSSSALVSQCQSSLFSDSPKTILPFGLSLVQKKGRTHSDSAIYKSDKKKTCLRSSLSSSNSLCPEFSDPSACKTVSKKNLTTCDSNLDVSTDISNCPYNDGKDIFVEPDSLNKRNLMLPSLLLNFGELNHFTFAQEKSPKMYWLRRHSDSNVARKQKDHIDAEQHSLRSQSACAKIQQAAGAEAANVQEQVSVDNCSLDVKKCQKVKKYLQTRYMNQSLDIDEVFMDCSPDAHSSRPEEILQKHIPAETAKAQRSENIDSQVTPSNKETSREVYEESKGSASMLNLQNYMSTDVEDVKENESVKRPLSEKTRHRLLQENDDSSVVSDNSSQDLTLSHARQSAFDFSFPSSYSVSPNLPVCSTNAVYGLLPSGCLSNPFLSGSVNLETFALKSSSSPRVLVSALHGIQDSALSSPGCPSESNKWQTGTWDTTGCSQGTLQSTFCEHSSGTKPDRLACSSHLETHYPLNLTTFMEPSSDGSSCTFVKSINKDDEIQPVVSLSVSTSSSCIVTQKGSLHILSSPLPSSPLIGTPTKSSPQVVFDYQFSEKIHELRQTGDNSNFVCPVCSSIFLSYNSLANHVVSHLPSEVITQEGSDSSKVHLCKVCNRSFSRSDMLSRHMRLHTGLRPYECHLCQQVFSRSDHLHTHLRTHTGEKPYRCSHCMYAAPRRDMVTRHMRIHVRGGTRRGRRSSSTSSLASESGQISDDTERSSSQTGRSKLSSELGKTGSLARKQRNWSVTSSENIDGPDGGFDDRDLSKMTRTESTTSIDSGVSYLTPRSLVPSLWSPGIDSPDVFSWCPGHFLWPTTSSDLKHEMEKDSPNSVTKDTDFEMHASFQKCKVTSPSAPSSSQMVETETLQKQEEPL